MNQRLSGKVAVVTGAAGGIGLAAAARLIADGARVVMVDLNETLLRESAAALGEAAHPRRLDIADQAAGQQLFAWIDSRFGGLDILVNNAGIGGPRTLEDMTADTWRRTFAVNMEGTLFCTQNALPLLKRRGGGAIINVASVAGKRLSHHGGADYTASKSAVLGFTRHAAFELAVHRIRVNAICPGLVLTPMVEAVTNEAQRTESAAKIPMGRWILPEDIAASVAFLASDDAQMITGSTIDVDGGLMVSNGQPYAEYFARRGKAMPAAPKAAGA